jgi:hypothetical protein
MLKLCQLSIQPISAWTNQGVDENQMKDDCSEEVVMLKLYAKFIQSSSRVRGT